ncbi:histidinol dehydrogenase [Emticicia sp. CRIBPO]|uniref:histidinol dehydrogenase n=1 Tax=Emticicia sp. CRIBPO TaxID=2683258 RepID=UPI0014125B9F|nr:histidinol dehydrogenase [Emticicia sp. CRIBPO]NBA87608.1 histidinol dehydrogenase [Emticicia sp. CRIBPO]
MQIIEYPKSSEYAQLAARPVLEFEEIENRVKPILDAVRSKGDEALRKFALDFDNVLIDDFAVDQQTILDAEKKLSPELKEAIIQAYQNIRTFHQAQKQEPEKIETMPGVWCWRKSVGIDKVGIYIPGGTAPLFSTVLMLGIPAQIAGCKEVILCSPSNHPAIYFAAKLAGITKVFRVGGAQAIAALAYGTESIPKVYKIFGPGNQYVTAAKQLITKEGIAIDMPAGPSEVAVLADESSNPAYVASDLLSQAEHGTDSQVILLATSRQVIDAVLKEIETQVALLPRQEIARKALENSKAILVENTSQAVEFLNEYAAEHLILAVENPEEIAEEITNAGSIFLGHFTPESCGDYASGTNHTLPTNGFARAYSGVSLDSFVKKITFQKITKEGLRNVGPVVELMAEAESLHAHKNAVTIRLKD